jgi:AcrR family transcriptional regulator
MGIKERHERDREAVRQLILDAARELFVREGFENVSIRKIAERIEYSPAAIYGYFPSKDDIFFSLAEDGFRLLYGDQRDVEALDALPPLERLRAIFWRLYEFSCNHPQYFALMFVDRSVPRIGHEYERFAFAREMKAHFIDELDRCVRGGVFPPHIPPAAAFRLLSTGLIGVATLRLSQRLSPDEDADALARDMLDVTIAGLRSGMALRSTAGPACDLDPAAIEVSSQESLS